MAVTKTINIKVDSKDAEKSLDNINQETKEVNKSTEKLTGTLDKMTGGAASGFKNFVGGLKNVAIGFKGVGAAIAASGLGLLVITIAAVISAFKASEEGQNKFAKLMGVIGSITGNLMDLLSDFGELVIWVFENPKKAITEFANLIKENIINRFNGLLELIPKLGKAIGLLFERKFKEAAKVAADAAGKVVLGVESITDATQKAIDKTGEFIKELEREAKIAAQIADKRAKADKIDRELTVERAKADRDIAELREKAARRDLYTAKQRQEFLKDASKISEDITNQEIEAAKLRRDAIIEENKLSKSNKEALDAEAQASAEVIRLETQRSNLQKRLGAELSAINSQLSSEAAARSKALQDEIDAIDKRSQELKDKWDKEAQAQKEKDVANRIEALQAIEDAENEFYESQLSEEDQEVLKKEEEFFRLIELAEQYGEDTTILEEARQEALLGITEKYEALRTEAQAKEDKEREKSAKALEDAKENLAFKGLDILQMIVGKGSKMAKGVAVAQATMSTYQGINAALSAVSVIPDPIGSALKWANAAAVGISGFLNVKNILKTNEAGTGGGSAGGASAPQPPAFNVVGNSGTSQIAQALDRDDEPIKAYVTSGDMTSQQEMDRNIRDDATIG